MSPAFFKNCFLSCSFELMDKILKCHHLNESSSFEQYFPMVLFILLYKVAPSSSFWLKP